jgi:sugar phosphate isomerase/epimerase
MTTPAHDPALTRRDFLAQSGASAALLAAAPLLGSALSAESRRKLSTAPDGSAAKAYPIGIEMYAVRGEMVKDLPGTLKTLKTQGYEVVEFFAPYQAWTLPYAKTVRAMLDDLGLKTHSTHNSTAAMVPGDMQAKAIELNQILGTRHMILSSPGMESGTVEEWKQLAARLTAASDVLRPHGLLAGMHNHDAEWAMLPNGQRVMELIAANTPSDFVLQLDVGTCVKAGADPVAWVNAHPGRIRSAHLKDWAPGAEAQEKSYRVLFGEGTSPWKPLVTALEATGGVEFYLMEQEGSRFSEFETSRRCLASWKALRRTL